MGSRPNLPLLRPRLSAAASFVRKGAVAADVGTDHGYLACFLAEEEICPKVYASDLNPGPLQTAEEHIRARGLEGKVVPLLSDGVRGLPLEEISDIVVAGMGGDLILSFLRDPGLRDPEKRLILQPMTKAEVLRRGLASLGYLLEEERAVRDGRFVYTVLLVRYTGETKEISDADAFCGLLSGKSREEREYLGRILRTMEKKRDGEKKREERIRAEKLIETIKERIGNGDDSR